MGVSPEIVAVEFPPTARQDQVYVTVMRDSDARGASRLRLVTVRLYSITNDRGEFLLDNLAPDSYCVVALPHRPWTSTAIQVLKVPNRNGSSHACA